MSTANAAGFFGNTKVSTFATERIAVVDQNETVDQTSGPGFEHRHTWYADDHLTGTQMLRAELAADIMDLTSQAPTRNLGTVAFPWSSAHLTSITTGLADQTIAFSNAGVLTGDTNLTWDDVEQLLRVIGVMELTHTATESDDHALEIICDAAGFSDVKALDIDYISGAITATQDAGVILVNIDQTAATGGRITGLEVLATSGLAKVEALFAGVGVAPIEHLSGTFGDADTVLVNAVDETTDLSAGGAGNVSIFAADNDTMTFGLAAKFQEVDVMLGTGSSGAGISPVFEFSTGVGTWATFGPADGTNAFRNTGVIAWENSDIPAWAVGTGSEFLIRVTRTRNSLATTPIADQIEVSATSEFKWDKDGNVTVKSLGAGSTASGVLGRIDARNLQGESGQSLLLSRQDGTAWATTSTTTGSTNLGINTRFNSDILLIFGGLGSITAEWDTNQTNDAWLIATTVGGATGSGNIIFTAAANAGVDHLIPTSADPRLILASTTTPTTSWISIRHLGGDAEINTGNAGAATGRILSNTTALFAVGSAANPTYTFAAQGNIGMYRSASSVLGWSTDGAERMTLSNTAFTLASSIDLLFAVTNTSDVGSTSSAAANVYTRAVHSDTSQNLTLGTISAATAVAMQVNSADVWRFTATTLRPITTATQNIGSTAIAVLTTFTRAVRPDTPGNLLIQRGNGGTWVTLGPSSSPVIGLDTIFTASAVFNDNFTLVFGSSGDALMDWSTGQTNNGIVLGTGVGSAGQSGNIVFTAVANAGIDHLYTTTPDVRLILANTAAPTTDFLSFTHDGANAVITSAGGGVTLFANSVLALTLDTSQDGLFANDLQVTRSFGIGTTGSGVAGGLNMFSTAAAPILVLQREAIVPGIGDEVGRIEFTGDDSASNDTVYAELRTLSHVVTAGSEVGLFDLRVNLNGTLITAMQVFGDNEGIVFNPNSADRDHRFAGDTLTHMLYLEGNAASENIVLLAASLPAFNSMDRGMFWGNVTTAPTAAPIGGAYVYVEAGAVTVMGSGTNTLTLHAINAGVVGPVFTLYHDSSTPADNDLVARDFYFANDSGATKRLTHVVDFRFDDVTSTTMDSQIFWAVMDNVNAGNANTVAALNSIGEWTNACAAANKTYEPDSQWWGAESALSRLRRLPNARRVYRSSRIADDSPKIDGAIRSAGPSAEDWYDTMGLGTNPHTFGNHKGIGGKTMAAVAIAGVLDLDDEVAALRAENVALRGRVKALEDRQ